jgi:hypothetical protein
MITWGSMNTQKIARLTPKILRGFLYAICWQVVMFLIVWFVVKNSSLAHR